MAKNFSKRFSLDKVEIDPILLNRIMSADGDEELGSWNGDSVHDLVKELERIEKSADANYSSLPHQSNIPEDLKAPITLDYPIWTCDKSGLCLVGNTASEVEDVDTIRAFYKEKFGGVEKFKEKLEREIKERNEKLKQ